MANQEQFNALGHFVSVFGNKVVPARLLRLALVGLALFVLSLPADAEPIVAEPAAADPEIPDFVFSSLYSPNRGVVYGVYEGRHADLVLVAGGFDSGFRSGMVCNVRAEGNDIAEIIMVDVRENTSAALIRDLKPENVIVPGQSVRIKTVNL